MPMKYVVRGNDIVDEDGAVIARASEAGLALACLEQAWYLNDVKRRYTAAARLIAEVEALPGFEWANQPSEVDDRCRFCGERAPEVRGEVTTCDDCGRKAWAEIDAFDQSDCGGAFDGNTVTSDADPGL